MSPYQSDEPPERSARPVEGRAPLSAEPASAEDPSWQATLESWVASLPALTRRQHTPLTTTKLADSGRICREFLSVLRGTEPGEGTRAGRRLLVVRALGRVHALAAVFDCPGGTFIELVATAPWNLLGRGDPADPRTVHGAGTAVVLEAIARSRRRGLGGCVALQAGSPCSVGFYERMGFRRMVPADRPLWLVPQGDHGWSPEIGRVAHGTPGPDEERMPWLVRPPDAAAGAARALA